LNFILKIIAERISFEIKLKDLFPYLVCLRLEIFLIAISTFIGVFGSQKMDIWICIVSENFYVLSLSGLSFHLCQVRAEVP